jgi:hypothetical protein
MCRSQSATGVEPVPVFELAGIAGLLDVLWQAIPSVRHSAAKKAAAEIVAGPRRPYHKASRPPGLSPIIHFCKPLFTELTVLVMEDFEDLDHVGLLSPLFQRGEAQFC